VKPFPAGKGFHSFNYRTVSKLQYQRRRRFFKGKKLKCQQIKGAIYCNISLLNINNVAVEAITAARSISNFKILIFIAENYILINYINLKAWNFLTN